MCLWGERNRPSAAEQERDAQDEARARTDEGDDVSDDVDDDVPLGEEDLVPNAALTQKAALTKAAAPIQTAAQTQTAAALATSSSRNRQMTENAAEEEPSHERVRAVLSTQSPVLPETFASVMKALATTPAIGIQM